MILAKLDIKKMPKNCKDNCPLYIGEYDEDACWGDNIVHRCVLGGDNWGCLIERPGNCPLMEIQNKK